MLAEGDGDGLCAVGGAEFFEDGREDDAEQRVGRVGREALARHVDVHGERRAVEMRGGELRRDIPQSRRPSHAVVAEQRAILREYRKDALHPGRSARSIFLSSRMVA